jgi:hypothetical protein
MTRRRATAALSLTMATLAVLAAGCASTSSRPAAAAAQPPLPSLASSVTSADAAWVTLPMGAPSGPNEFWQLFTQAGSSRSWTLRTPPDIATNGALVLAVQDPQTLVTGIRPSLDLAFSPITMTSDGGSSWSTVPPEPGLADLPDALAATAKGQLIALDQEQQVQTAGAGGSWTEMTTEKTLASSAAGRSCTLSSLTAAAFTPAGSPLLAGTCGQAGVAGIFGDSGGAWHLAGPTLPAALAGQRVQVVRLTQTADGDVALLEAGSLGSVKLVAAWSSDGGQHWALSPVADLGSSYAVSTSFGRDSAVGVALSNGSGQTVSGPGSSWQQLPALPAGRAVALSLPAAGSTEALAADGSTLTVWQLTGSPGRWAKTQSISVPIQYGSSSSGN